MQEADRSGQPHGIGAVRNVLEESDGRIKASFLKSSPKKIMGTTRGSLLAQDGFFLYIHIYRLYILIPVIFQKKIMRI